MSRVNTRIVRGVPVAVPFDGGTITTALHITATTQSTSVASGALIVDGGVGIVKDVFIGGGTNIVGQLLLDNGTIGAPGLGFTADGSYGLRFTPAAMAMTAAGSHIMAWYGVGAVMGGATNLAWSAGDPTSTTADVKLIRDEAAGALALRDGVIGAQLFRIYETYTDVSNYSRLSFITTAGDHTITPEAAGTGTLRDLVLGAAGVEIDIAADNIIFTVAGSTNAQNIQFASGSVGFYGVGNQIRVSAIGTEWLALHSSGVTLQGGTGTSFGWGTGVPGGSAHDTSMHKDVAGSVGFRAPSQVHRLNVYEEWTSASDYARLAVITTAGDYTITPESAGGPTLRDLRLGAAGVDIFVDADSFVVTNPGHHAFGLSAASLFNQYEFGGDLVSASAAEDIAKFVISDRTTATTDTENMFGLHVLPTFTTSAGTTTMPLITAARFVAPSITDNLTGGAVITVAATVQITGAPTAGVDNYSLLVSLGETRVFAFSAVSAATFATNVIVGHTAKINMASPISDTGAPESPNTQILGESSNDSYLGLVRNSADAFGPGLIFGKSRNAATGSFTVVQDNDLLGAIVWAADGGSDINTTSARIRALVDDSAPATSSVGGQLIFEVARGVSNNDITEAFRIDANLRSFFAERIVVLGDVTCEEVIASDLISTTSATDTTSGTTGSVHTAGGVGIAKALFVGTTATVTGDIISESTTASTTTTTGAIQTDGGLGVVLDAFIGGLINVGTTATIVGAFGCNAQSAQTAFVSGGALAAYATGAFGLDSDVKAEAQYDLIVAIRAALVANGIMS